MQAATIYSATILKYLLARAERASAGHIAWVVLDKIGKQVAAIVCWQRRRDMSALLECLAHILAICTSINEVCDELRMPEHSHVCSPELSELAAATLLLSSCLTGMTKWLPPSSLAGAGAGACEPLLASAPLITQLGMSLFGTWLVPLTSSKPCNFQDDCHFVHTLTRKGTYDHATLDYRARQQRGRAGPTTTE